MTERRVQHPHWRPSHEPTPYPFKDTATLRGGDGVCLPELTFLDAILYPIGVTTALYLSEIVIDHQNATIYIGDTAQPKRCSCAFDLVLPPDELRLLDVYGRPAGLLVSEQDRLAIFQSWSTESHTFNREATEFVADVCVPTPEIGLRGFVLEDGSVFTEDIWLIGDDGIVLTLEDHEQVRKGCLGESEDQTVIRVDVVGDPLFRRRLCQDLFTTPRLLQTIVVRDNCKDFICGPDNNGDFKISTGHQDTEQPILRVGTTPHGLVITAIGEKLGKGRDR